MIFYLVEKDSAEKISILI